MPVAVKSILVQVLLKMFTTYWAQLVALSVSKNTFTAQTQITISAARFSTKRTFLLTPANYA